MERVNYYCPEGGDRRPYLGLRFPLLSLFSNVVMVFIPVQEEEAEMWQILHLKKKNPAFGREES